MSKTILLLPGDGIGPEVVSQVKRVVEWVVQNSNLEFNIIERPVGGTSYDLHNTPLTDETLELAKSSDAVLLGAVGGPKWDNVDRDKRPEAALLKLRKELGLFANLRPALVFAPLAQASSLKPHLVEGLDILIVRELTGGVYFGQPRGIETLSDGSKRGVDTQVYTSHEIERIGRVAFDLAKKRNNKVTSAEKANVMESGVLWRQEIQALHDKEFNQVELEHMYADNCAMQLVRQPKQFDVIVTDNLFGDILSDCAAMLTGSLGMLPSASLGARINGKQLAMYEPVHGSAPDIAGQNKANPLATLLSFCMMLKYSFDAGDIADEIEKAVIDTLEAGIRTGDIQDDQCQLVTTVEMIDHVINRLNLSQSNVTQHKTAV